ncbi:MAG: zinc-binding alcohol dehydrogenase [Planctomycetota bacterium]|nr:zinc-binding alcohol dehydrogenase [Planctomycetota bacterium]MDA1137637.1 zinc-binding alcohol dehydrogenase [Planctomycetota bacterium]
MKTKAISFPERLRAELVERDLPKLNDNQVLVRCTVSHISTGTESFCFRGEFDEGTTWARWVKYPFSPGYSTVGEVIEMGSAVTKLKAGDRVQSSSTHAQYHVLNESAAQPVPDSISDEVAGWAILATTTQTALRRAQLVMGDTAVVIGLGPLGQLVTRYLRSVGLSRILAIDTVAHRLALATSGGATDVFMGSAADAKEFVVDACDGKLADVVFDVTGHWAVLPLALPLARDFGKVVLLGDSPTPSKQHLTQDVLGRQVTLIGTHSTKLPPDQAHWTLAKQIQLFYEYVTRGVFKTDGLITHRYRPEEAPEVYQKLQTNRTDTLGVLFDWASE